MISKYSFIVYNGTNLAILTDVIVGLCSIDMNCSLYEWKKLGHFGLYLILAWYKMLKVPRQNYCITCWMIFWSSWYNKAGPLWLDKHFLSRLGSVSAPIDCCSFFMPVFPYIHIKLTLSLKWKYICKLINVLNLFITSLCWYITPKRIIWHLPFHANVNYKNLVALKALNV
jgi:hypothetical protein